MSDERITVMACTRGRVQQLDRYLKSFEETTAKPELVEFWLGIDSDDKATLDFLENRPCKIKVNKFVRGRSPNLHNDYLNPMAERGFLASEMVFATCDDIVMKTFGWDTILRWFVEAYLPKDRIAYIGIEDGTVNPTHLNFNSPPFSNFPILTKQAWRAQGFGFFHPSLLSWSADVTLFILWSHPLVNRACALPQIEVEHICHHNGNVSQDATSLSMGARHAGQVDECQRIISEDIPGQVQRLKKLIHARKVWFCVLPERANYDISLKMAQRISYRAGRNGYIPMYTEYGCTDVVRQGLATEFMRQSKSPRDTLVMLDIDMDHPADIVEKLVSRDVPVVAPLYFRRGPAFEACAFRRNGDGGLHHLATFQPGLHRMDAVGTGAIAIQRHVFDTLKERGHNWFFRYEYMDKYVRPSEDLYFCKLCEQAGIEMYVDTTIEVPHIGYGFVGREAFEDYRKDHPGNGLEAIQQQEIKA